MSSVRNNGGVGNSGEAAYAALPLNAVTNRWPWPESASRLEAPPPHRILKRGNQKVVFSAPTRSIHRCHEVPGLCPTEGGVPGIVPVPQAYNRDQAWIGVPKHRERSTGLNVVQVDGGKVLTNKRLGELKGSKDPLPTTTVDTHHHLRLTSMSPTKPIPIRAIHPFGVPVSVLLDGTARKNPLLQRIPRVTPASSSAEHPWRKQGTSL
ncbi:hypothetical protein QBC40DRAFT_347299 [Triangularia verruculosa]|uniref:Uncharacterized protein n=1 Tax=Triangularia verruculosa TaxID=2587418 RepID=A0AAN7AUZ3_9PEZI|nr:hypothetical protein QBC40DRAFT_347299 [Triangularia verruculosa]